MKRKTLILREDQFNEICGLNTSYLDNPSDFAKDGTTQIRTDGAVSDSFGGKEDYSDPMTGDDYSDSMAPETLWAVLFRNGGHGLWGHWGSGMRTSHLSGVDKAFTDEFEDDEVYNNFPDDENFRKELDESNSELEGRSWNGNSYTNLTTKKTQYKQQLAAMRNSNAPAQQIKRVQAAYNAVSGVLNRETGAIKARKTARKNMGMPNQFQKPGGSKNSGNGKAHTRKKTIDPNVGTGFITYK